MKKLISLFLTTVLVMCCAAAQAELDCFVISELSESEEWLNAAIADESYSSTLILKICDESLKNGYITNYRIYYDENETLRDYSVAYGIKGEALFLTNGTITVVVSEGAVPYFMLASLMGSEIADVITFIYIEDF